DGFNRLLLGAELAARQVVVLRAFCRYLLQTGVPFSQASMERALGANPDIARNLVRLFEARFQPAAARSRRGGPRGAETLAAQILGLMKAQNVKNTLIVPVGAKGGFVVKRPPAGKGEDVQAEVVACYQTFIRGLLDLTDNILAGRIVPPPRLVRHDGDDPYLV